MNYRPKTQMNYIQKEVLEKLKKQNKAIIANECGTGKSKSAIDGMLYHLNDTDKKVLVLAPTFEIATNWKSEVEKHCYDGWAFIGSEFNSANKLCASSRNNRSAQLKWLDNALRYSTSDINRFIIMQADTLKIKSVHNILNDLIDEEYIGGIICDEAHKLVNVETQRTEAYLKLGKPRYEYMLTATPVRNYFNDMFMYCSRLGISVPHYAATYNDFKQTFTEKGKTGRPCGNRNYRLLKECISPYLIQYGKEFLVDELPRLNEYNYHINNAEEINGKIREILDGYTETCALAIMTQAEKAAFIYKGESANQLIFSLLMSGKQVVVFSRFTEQLEYIKFGAKLNCSCSAEKIHREVEEFKKGNTRVICSTYGCLGAGIELCPATEIIILDEPWTQADIEQAVSRIHRLSNPNPVCNIHYIRLPKSVDGHIHKIVHNKGVTGTFNDNKKFFGDDELLNEERIKF